MLSFVSLTCQCLMIVLHSCFADDLAEVNIVDVDGMSSEITINDAIVSNVTLCVSYFGNGVNFSDVAVSVDFEVTGGKYIILS